MELNYVIINLFLKVDEITTRKLIISQMTNRNIKRRKSYEFLLYSNYVILIYEIVWPKLVFLYF